MGRIKDYPNDGTITINDKVIGSDVSGATYNYPVGSIASLLATTLGTTVKVVAQSVLPSTTLPLIDADTPIYMIINAGATGHLVNPTSPNTIEGLASLTTLNYDAFFLVPDTTTNTWYAI